MRIPALIPFLAATMLMAQTAAPLDAIIFTNGDKLSDRIASIASAFRFPSLASAIEARWQASQKARC